MERVVVVALDTGRVAVVVVVAGGVITCTCGAGAGGASTVVSQLLRPKLIRARARNEAVVFIVSRYSLTYRRSCDLRVWPLKKLIYSIS